MKIRSILIIPAFLSIVCFPAISAHASPIYRLDRFDTDQAAIYYSDKRHLERFLWKIGGIEPAPELDMDLARSRIDRIIVRVKDILAMYPDDLRLEILLKDGYESGYIAFYSQTYKTITVYVDRVTDGVLAHEIAHAVIDAYFDIAVSSTVQEILCRYVDEQLWEDY